MKINTVGVVGAGVMGTGLGQVLAQSGLSVILIDVSDTILEKARGKIEEGLRLQRLLNGDSKINRSEVLARIQLSTDLKTLAAADFVVENVTEQWAIKEPVYRALDSICPPHTVFAANTSAISITKIGSVTTRARQVLGMHFMNPVPMKPTVEVIQGYHTSTETLQAANELLERIGKNGIVVNDAPGFVSNRVLMLTINEAVFLLQEGVASADSIDRIFKECFGHKMGPLATADLIGLDTILLSLEVLYESFNDSKYRPCPLLRKLVDAGLQGCKSGRGFFSYLR